MCTCGTRWHIQITHLKVWLGIDPVQSICWIEYVGGVNVELDLDFINLETIVTEAFI